MIFEIVCIRVLKLNQICEYAKESSHQNGILNSSWHKIQY